jgi:hypothetical protein
VNASGAGPREVKRMIGPLPTGTLTDGVV